MNIISLFSKKSFALVFSLICGLAYLGIISRFVLENTATGGSLLLVFIFPAVICGAALIIFKAIQAYLETESARSLAVIFWGHIIVILLSILTVAELIIN